MATEAKPRYRLVGESQLLAARQAAHQSFALYGRVDFFFDFHTLQEKSPISKNSPIVIPSGAEWRDADGPQAFDWPAEVSRAEWAEICSSYDGLRNPTESALSPDVLYIIELGTHGQHNPEGLKLLGQTHPTAHHAALNALWVIGATIDECRSLNLEADDPRWHGWIRSHANSFRRLMPWLVDSYNAISQEWRAAVRYLESRPSLADEEEPQPTAVDKPGDEAFLSYLDIAKRFNLSPEAVRKRLERWRKKNLDGWREVDDRRRTEPLYLYQYLAVRHLFDR